MRSVSSIFVAVTLLAATASAQTKEECIAASENAQKLRDQHKLNGARQQFLTCAREACPDAIRQDCTEQVQKTADRIPTIAAVTAGCRSAHAIATSPAVLP